MIKTNKLSKLAPLKNNFGVATGFGCILPPTHSCMGPTNCECEEIYTRNKVYFSQLHNCVKAFFFFVWGLICAGYRLHQYGIKLSYRMRNTDQVFFLNKKFWVLGYRWDRLLRYEWWVLSYEFWVWDRLLRYEWWVLSYEFWVLR